MFEDLKNDQKNKVDDIFADSDQGGDDLSVEKPVFSQAQPGQSPRLASEDFVNKKIDPTRFNDFEDSGSRSGKILKRIFLVIIILAVIGAVAYFVYAKILVPRAFSPDILNDNQIINNNINNEQNIINSTKDEEINGNNVNIVDDNIIFDDTGADLDVNDPAIELLKNLDSDGDGLSDYDESYIYLTNPNNPDTDGDGLNDYEEVFVFGPDPLNPDTDDDGYLDGQEVMAGYNPLGEGKINPNLFVNPTLFQEMYPNLLD